MEMNGVSEYLFHLLREERARLDDRSGLEETQETER